MQTEQKITSVELQDSQEGFICHLCSRQFANDVEQKEHTQRHRLMRYKCLHSSCGWMFETDYMLKWHSSIHHASESFTSKTCDMNHEGKVEADVSSSKYPEHDPHPEEIVDSVPQSELTYLEKMMLVDFSDTSKLQTTDSGIRNSDRNGTQNQTTGLAELKY